MNPVPPVPQPPVDMVMPALWQNVFLIAGAVAILPGLVFAVRTAITYRDVLPLVFLPAGFITIPMESVLCDMGRCWHPAIGQYNLYVAFGQSIPWHLGLMYTLYYGMFYLLGYRRMQQGELTAKYLWTSYGGWVVGTYLLVIVVRQTGLWTQYGHQPLWFWHGSHPPFWTFTDVSSVVVPFGLVVVLHHLLRGWWRLLIVFASPVGAVAGHIGPGLPFYWVANSSHEADQWWVQLSGLAGVALSVACVAVVIKLVTVVPLSALGPAAPAGADSRPASLNHQGLNHQGLNQ